MPCVRIPLGQPIPDDPITGKPQLGSKNPLNCGCPICPTRYYCSNGPPGYDGDCDGMCALDSPEHQPCDLGGLVSCGGVQAYDTEVNCIQSCIVMPPCCGDVTKCNQQIQYFNTREEAEAFCGTAAALPGAIEFEGRGAGVYCEIRKAVQDGFIKWAAAYCTDACQCPDCPSPVLPLSVYRTGGFAFPPNNAAGCGFVLIGNITTKDGDGSSIDVSWPDVGFPVGGSYNSVETQVKDACGRCVFSANLPNNAPIRAIITVKYSDCAVGFPFVNAPPWCNNPMC